MSTMLRLLPLIAVAGLIGTFLGCTTYVPTIEAPGMLEITRMGDSLYEVAINDSPGGSGIKVLMFMAQMDCTGNGSGPGIEMDCPPLQYLKLYIKDTTGGGGNQ